MKEWCSTDIIALNEEINLFNNILTTANITQNLTLSGTSKWSDYVNSDPVSVVVAARRTVQQQIGDFPNNLLLSQPVLDTLANHPRILDRVKYTANGARNQLDEQDLARVFKVNKVLVSAAIYQTSNEGEADSSRYLMASPTPGCTARPGPACACPAWATPSSGRSAAEF